MPDAGRGRGRAGEEVPLRLVGVRDVAPGVRDEIARGVEDDVEGLNPVERRDDGRRRLRPAMPCRTCAIPSRLLPRPFPPAADRLKMRTAESLVQAIDMAGTGMRAPGVRSNY